MSTPAELQVQSFDVIAREVIAPAVIGRRMALEVGAFQTRGAVSHDAARRARYRPVRIGWDWGPAWSTCWFRLRGRVPHEMSGGQVWLRFCSDTEALLWVDGVPWHGFDVNRELALLPGGTVAGGRAGTVELLVEAACNHPLGAGRLAWEHSEAARRWRGARPGRLSAAELVTVNEPVQRLLYAWRLAVELARELLVPPPAITTHSAKFPENKPWQEGRCEELLGALRAAWQLIDTGDVPGLAAGALRVLEAALRREPAASATICHAVGHAHIDTAWLWPLRETRRKCLRTFSNVLRLMERNADFRFVCTQAQQYAFVEEDSPALLRRIGARIAQGRWEIGGPMWVEPDCHVPTPESLIRQVLHGTRYFRERFGERAADQRFLFLPDTFGFPAHLPQVMRHCGLDTFITNKIAWNDTNPYPHTTFTWRGNDGSEVLAHFTPGHDYNTSNSPRELRRGETNHRTRQLVAADEAARGNAAGARWLQPFGHGDGGGGPTEAMISNARSAASCDGLPRVRMSGLGEFRERLQADVAAARRRGDTLPEFAGELYLELHRGTLTTQAWLKRAMREAEDDLRLAELLMVMRFAGSPRGGTQRDLARSRQELDAAWKTVLLNQFHDILPGSSIKQVYDDAREQMTGVKTTLRRQIADHLRAIAQQLEREPRLPKQQMLVVNPASVPTGQVVMVNGEPRLFTALAASVNVDAGWTREELRCDPVELRVDTRRTEATLDNGTLAATIDRFGRIVRLKSEMVSGKAWNRPLNVLMLHEDLPRAWEAWDLDETYALKGQEQLQEPTEWRVLERHPLRCSIQITRPLGVASVITQTFTLDATSARLDIHTRVEWNESRRVLRALFPTGIESSTATFDTGGGFLERSTRNNTSHERAAFEVPAHRWVDLSDPGGGRGLAVLNDCKYGHSCKGGTIGMTLLRAPRYPDLTADIGVHEFRYSILPHEGDWRAIGVPAEAERLHRPLMVLPLPSGASRAPRKGAATVQPISVEPVDGTLGVGVSAIKFAEEDGRLIVRLQERLGRPGRVDIQWNLPVRKVTATDGLERPLKRTGLSFDRAKRRSTLRIKPLEIVTLAATL